MTRYKMPIVTEVILSVVFLFSVICHLPSAVYAEGNLHVGTLEIDPFVSIEQEYDDNIFLEPNNQENDDWITTTTLGVGLQMPIVVEREEDFLFKAEYTADIIEFWDQNEQDRVDHNFLAAADFAFANDLTLKIAEDFKKTADPPNSELTSLEKRLRNAVDLVLGYAREKIGFDLGYKNIKDDYNNFNSLDKYKHVITTTAYYQLFPKTSVFGEYNFGKIAYDSDVTNSDSKYHQLRLGVKGELAPKLTGVVKAGYKNTSYDDSSKDDFKGLTVFGNLGYDLRERTKLNIYGERSSVESTYSINSYFVSNKTGLNCEHQLLEILFLTGGASCQLNKYPDETTESSVTAKRKDYIWSGGIGLRYEAKKWVFVETSYEYKQRDSKFAAFDYKDNKFAAKITCLF